MEISDLAEMSSSTQYNRQVSVREMIVLRSFLFFLKSGLMKYIVIHHDSTSFILMSALTVIKKLTHLQEKKLNLALKNMLFTCLVQPCSVCIEKNCALGLEYVSQAQFFSIWTSWPVNKIP